MFECLVFDMRGKKRLKAKKVVLEGHHGRLRAGVRRLRTDQGLITAIRTDIGVITLVHLSDDVIDMCALCQALHDRTAFGTGNDENDAVRHKKRHHGGEEDLVYLENWNSGQRPKCS